METGSREVLDISSDEEEEEGGSEPTSNWLECLLDTIEKEADSDEVVVLGSSACEDESSKLKVKLKDDLKVKDDFDDECMILDGDPDKPTEVAKDAADGSDGDDLMVVSEKGQIACRDYPHPRHLCARYPFSTNPHEKFCDLCHCYVCDIQAPCIYWGSGASITDHCHSNDKEEIWKLRRKCYKQGILAPLPAVKHPSNAYSTVPPLHNSVPAVVLSQPQPNRNIPVHVLSRSNTLPTGRNFGVPNIMSQHHTPNRIRLPNGVSRATSFSPSSSAANRTVLDKLGGGHLGVSQPVNFKRVGSGVVGVAKGRAVHSSYGNNSQVGNACMVQQQLQQLPQRQPHPHPQPQAQVQVHGQPHSQRQPYPQAQAQAQGQGHPNPQRQPLPQAQGQPHPQRQPHQQAHPHPHSHPHPQQPPHPLAQAQGQPHAQRLPHTHSLAQAQAQPQLQKYHTPASYNNIRSRSQLLRVCTSTPQQHNNNYSTASYPGVQHCVPSTRGPEVSAGACQVGSQSSDTGTFVVPQSYPISLQSEVYEQPLVRQPTENVESYLVDDPTLSVPNQSLTNYELNFLNDAAQSLVSAVQYPEPPSTQPTSNSSPAIETVPVTSNLTSANFDLETWINSLDDAPPQCGKEALSTPLDFVPLQSELPEETLWFDFENLHNYI